MNISEYWVLTLVSVECVSALLWPHLVADLTDVGSRVTLRVVRYQQLAGPRVYKHETQPDKQMLWCHALHDWHTEKDRRGVGVTNPGPSYTPNLFYTVHISRLCENGMGHMTRPPWSPDRNPDQMIRNELELRTKAKLWTSAQHLWETVPGGRSREHTNVQSCHQGRQKLKCESLFTWLFWMFLRYLDRRY